jgi:hypothetical protein
MNDNWLFRAEHVDWSEVPKSFTERRFRPLYDRQFSALHRRLATEAYVHDPELKAQFIHQFHSWLLGSSLNRVEGLEAFKDRDFILGVTHALDDLHICYGEQLVTLEEEYLYHQRIRPAIRVRTLATLQSGDILVMGAPFAHFGALHPQTSDLLSRCMELSVPVHVDAAWYGCLTGFNFNYDHPAIQSVSFSLSKGLGLGTHRTGVRYCRQRHPGPVTVINDFKMESTAHMWIGIQFMREFGSDYLQTRYGAAYRWTCEKLGLQTTQAIHLAYMQGKSVGVREILRHLVDEIPLTVQR